MQIGANWSANLMPGQDAGACGSRHRSGPMGGAAKGMPLNTVTSFSCTPSITPLSMRTAVATDTDEPRKARAINHNKMRLTK